MAVGIVILSATNEILYLAGVGFLGREFQSFQTTPNL